MVAIVNMDRIAERFGDIDSAKLVFNGSSEPMEYLMKQPGDENPGTVLEPTEEELAAGMGVEDVTGRQLIKDTSFEQLCTGLVASVTYFKGLCRALDLESVVLRGQPGGVYVVYKFKAV